jgi:hypothetical protein
MAAEMRPSQPLAVLALFLTAVVLLATTVTFVLSGPSVATVVVLAVALLALAGACVVGAGSARWRSNPYW